jgi:hypothetical protein
MTAISNRNTSSGRHYGKPENKYYQTEGGIVKAEEPYLVGGL